MNIRMLMVGFGMLGAAAAAQAGTVVHMAWHSLPGGKLQPRTVIYAQNGAFRMDSLDDAGHVQDFTLVRDGNIWMVNVVKRTFVLFDKAALADRKAAMESHMQSELQRLPAAQRVRMEAVMQSMMQRAQQTSFTIADAGHSDRVGAWSCETWQMTLNGKVVSDACVARGSAITGGRELVQAARKAATTAEQVFASQPLMRATAQRMAWYAKVDGFPVRTRSLNRGKPDDEDVVSSIESKSLPADTFAIPKGFTQTNMGEDSD